MVRGVHRQPVQVEMHQVVARELARGGGSRLGEACSGWVRLRLSVSVWLWGKPPPPALVSWPCLWGDGSAHQSVELSLLLTAIGSVLLEGGVCLVSGSLLGRLLVEIRLATAMRDDGRLFIGADGAL